MDQKPIIFIIPARGGSKGVKNKNILDVNGVPLIAYSIKVAQSLCSHTGWITDIVVSTDSPAIVEIASDYGCASHLRPTQLARDLTPDFPVIRNVLRNNTRLESFNDLIIAHLRPTSPIRQASELIRLIETFSNYRYKEPSITSMRTVVCAHQNPHKLMARDEDTSLYLSTQLQKSNGAVSMMLNGPRQLLPKYYWGTGYLDLILSSNIANGYLHKPGHTILLDSPKYSIDIDSAEDVGIVSALLKAHPDLNPFHTF